MAEMAVVEMAVVVLAVMNLAVVNLAVVVEMAVVNLAVVEMGERHGEASCCGRRSRTPATRCSRSGSITRCRPPAAKTGPTTCR